MKVKFIGGAGTVTGSKFLIEGKERILIDAGMFQGSDGARNEEPLPFDPSSLSAVLLTHAHIDHCGMLPHLVSKGLSCPVWASAATIDLTKILLEDSAKLQSYKEGDALFGFEDVEKTGALFKKIQWGTWMDVAPGVRALFERVGHIVGASSITVEMEGKRVTFSGDLGRYDVPILKDPKPVELRDLLILESTYGDTEHPEEDVPTLLASAINDATSQRGMVLIPSFAVGRTQLLLYLIQELKDAKRIGDIPIIVDSPLAFEATQIVSKHGSEHDREMREKISEGQSPFEGQGLYFVRNERESQQLRGIEKPMILIASSGMLAGGRILRHLQDRLRVKENIIVLTGHQPEEGLGRKLLARPDEVEIEYENVPVRADIRLIKGLSAHAGRDELIRWCSECAGKPRLVALVHGEASSSSALKESLVGTLGWNVSIPEQGETIEL